MKKYIVLSLLLLQNIIVKTTNACSCASHPSFFETVVYGIKYHLFDSAFHVVLGKVINQTNDQNGVLFKVIKRYTHSEIPIADTIVIINGNDGFNCKYNPKVDLSIPNQTLFYIIHTTKVLNNKVVTEAEILGCSTNYAHIRNNTVNTRCAFRLIQFSSC